MSQEIDSSRRHPRVHANLPVRISTIDPETDPWTGKPFFRSTREWSANLSRGGLFVRTGEPLAPGRRVLVELTLPGGRAVEALGRVAWSRRILTPDGGEDDGGVGLQFVGTSGDQMAVLDRYLYGRDGESD